MWDWPLVLCTENMSVVSTDVFLLLLDVQHVLWRFFTSEFKKTGWVSTKSCMLLGKFTVPFKLLLLDNDKILISRQSRRLEEKKCLESVYYIAWQQYWTAFFFFLITLYLSRESPIYGHSLHLSHSLLTCLHDLGEPQWRHERGRTDTGGHVTWTSPANRWANSTADRLLLQLQPMLSPSHCIAVTPGQRVEAVDFSPESSPWGQTALSC